MTRLFIKHLMLNYKDPLGNFKLFVKCVTIFVSYNLITIEHIPCKVLNNIYILNKCITTIKVPLVCLIRIIDLLIIKYIERYTSV